MWDTSCSSQSDVTSAEENAMETWTLLFFFISTSSRPWKTVSASKYRFICYLFEAFQGGATMWIQVRTIDGKETRTVEDLSRLTKIESLRLKIQDIFNVSPQQQRLFYRGKQVKPIFMSPRHAPVGFGCFGRGSVLVESEWSTRLL